MIAVTWPIQLEYFFGWSALGLFALLGAPLLWLGMRSLNNLGPVRKWVAIGVRLAVLGVLILILGGIRWQRRSESLDVMVLRDISLSTGNVHNFPGKDLPASLDQYLLAASKDPRRSPDDRVGLISFATNAAVDAMPSLELDLNTRAIHEAGNQTDAGAAIQLALATLGRNAMRRMVLVWDGNATSGDLESAILAAGAHHVPIDVMPLHYDVQNEVVLDRFIAPAWKRENEPFTLDVILRSTNAAAVAGKLRVLHQDQSMEIDPDHPGQPYRQVTLRPGLNVEHIFVPSLHVPGVHQFHAVFEPDEINVAGSPPRQGDTILDNNTADAFTFVRGKGQVLYVDNVADGRGQILGDALASEGIDCQRVPADRFPISLVQMQGYDAIILANVPAAALSADQQGMLYNYVHEMGGGLVMIGGEDAFGAGGWQGSKVEQVLPVNMDVPAERKIPKGALVLCMDPAEVPDGNYWGEQCAMKAAAALSSQDEIGIITYNWGGPHGGRCNWDLPLGPKGDGSKSVAAIKKWGLGDLPSFEEAINLALDGDSTSHGLIASDARQKHIIVITDDDPEMPTRATIDRCIKANITVSTVTVYPHTPHNVAPGTRELAKLTGGRSFGPIEDNPGQLPQIFIKEATVVRRSLICEDAAGIPLLRTASASDMVKGITQTPPVYGMVLTSRKPDPQIEIPIVAGNNNDPLLAHWQTGLGRAAVFTSDAHNRWGANWVASPEYSKFWAQVIRGVSRPPMSSDFDIQTAQNGQTGKIDVEALGKDSSFKNFLNIAGNVVGPDLKAHPVRLVQTGPGAYSAEFDTPLPGNYVAVLQYTGQDGNGGILLTGVSMNSVPELRDLQSNDSLLASIARRTGGRMLPPFDPQQADWFNRAGLPPAVSPLPVWDLMIPILLSLILMDVATRRIAWDWEATKRIAALARQRIREFTLTRTVDTRQSIDALRRVRDEAEKQTAIRSGDGSPPAISPPPNRSAKFNAPGVEGDIDKLVGGAAAKPLPPPRRMEAVGASSPGSYTGNLLEAKRRAQKEIKRKEEESKQ